MNPKPMKFVVVGDGAVGKTCMLVSYATEEFPKKYVPTIFEQYTKDVVVDGTVYPVTLFDTAGQEAYDRLRVLSYPGTNVFLLCFSVVSPTSYKNIQNVWLPELRDQAPGIPIVLVGTKADLREDHDTLEKLNKLNLNPVTPSEGLKLARRIKASRYVECSALTRKGLNTVFQEALMCVRDPKAKSSYKPTVTTQICTCFMPETAD